MMDLFVKMTVVVVLFGKNFVIEKVDAEEAVLFEMVVAPAKNF